MSTTEEPIVMDGGSQDPVTTTTPAPVVEAPPSPQPVEEIKSTTDDVVTTTVEPVPVVVEEQQNDDKPVLSLDSSSSAPATPATLSVNEDVDADDSTEQQPAPSQQQEEKEATTPPKKKGRNKRTPFKYNPDKITLRFIFANRDGLSVTLDCEPEDTVGEVKGALLSIWPEELPDCTGGDRLRLICMGKGILMPDTRTLEDCQVPKFKTHPTPVNVSVRPQVLEPTSEKSGDGSPRGGSTNNTTDQGCACVIL